MLNIATRDQKKILISVDRNYTFVQNKLPSRVFRNKVLVKYEMEKK